MLSNATKNALDEELHRYRSIAREIAVRKLELETQREHDENIGGSSSGNISKPVEQLVLAYESDRRIMHLRQFQKDAESCMQALTDAQREIFNLRWLNNDSMSWEEIACDLHYSKKTIYRKRERILEIYATSKGII